MTRYTSSVSQTIYLVVCDGTLILGAYASPEHAEIHARTVTGAQVTPARISTTLPRAVLDELAAEHGNGDDFEGDTPVTKMPAE